MVKTEISVVIDIKGIGETKLSMQDAKKLYDSLNDLFAENVVYRDNWWWYRPYINPYGTGSGGGNPYPQITWGSETSSIYSINI
jgi:hypothetical protein